MSITCIPQYAVQHTLKTPVYNIETIRLLLRHCMLLFIDAFHMHYIHFLYLYAQNTWFSFVVLVFSCMTISIYILFLTNVVEGMISSSCPIVFLASKVKKTCIFYFVFFIFSACKLLFILLCREGRGVGVG